MTSVSRDMQVVDLVSHFQYMTSTQVRGAIFPDNASGTPTDRALSRLTRRGYLARFKWRHLPAMHAGTGFWVYQLGPAGWRHIGYDSPYKALTSFSRHQLAIGDAYVALKALEHAGQIRVLDFAAEPDVWVRIGNMELRPDLYVRLQTNSGINRFWLEVDLASEHKNQVKEKVRRYCRAYSQVDASNERWRVWPAVLLVVRNELTGNHEKRCEDLRRWIDEAAEVKGLFQACTFDELKAIIP